MEVWREQPEYLDVLLKEVAEKFGILHKREGIHLSDCLLCLRKSYWDKVDSLPPTPQELLYFVLGLGLQDTLQVKNSTVLELDGILLSPDYLTEAGTAVELKTTRLGSKRIEQHDFPKHWIRQLMGYTYALNQLEGDLMLLTIIRPDTPCFHYVFTEDELVDNWGQITTAAGILLQAIEEKRIPSKGNAQDWECASCRYRLRCAIIETGETKDKEESLC